MTARIWERLDPRDFADGVYYVPAALELQPRLPQWGHPGQPGLRERLANDRPHGIGGEKLLCLLCMRVRADRGLPVEPVWLTFVEGRHGPMFRHEDGRSPHAEHQPETDIHKALKERKARTFDVAGALEVDVEVWRPKARRKPDVLAVGPQLTVAGEVQHSVAPAREIQNRQKALRRAGDRVVWTTDRPAADIGFMHLVPHLALPTVGDHRYYLREPKLNLIAGAIVLERQRCGWSDLWTGTQRCPVTRKAVTCGQWHLYPTYDPRDRFAFPNHVDARFPATDRPHLDHLLEGILHGAWLPYRHRNRVTWIPAKEHDQVIAERGGDVEHAENANVRRRDRPAGRACEDRVDRSIPAQRDAPALERLTLPPRPPIQPQRPGVCAAGVTPCGQPARFYPGGWRCEEHIPTSRQENA